MTPTGTFGGEDIAQTSFCLSLFLRCTVQSVHHRTCSGSREHLSTAAPWLFPTTGRVLLQPPPQRLLPARAAALPCSLVWLLGRCSFWGFVTTPATCLRFSMHHPKAGSNSMMLLSTCLPQVSFVLREHQWLRASFCGFTSTCRFACYGERLLLAPRDHPQPSLIRSGLHPEDPMQGFLQNITALLVLTEESKPAPAMALST